MINNAVSVFISFEYLQIHASKINNQLSQSCHFLCQFQLAFISRLSIFPSSEELKRLPKYVSDNKIHRSITRLNDL